MHRKEKIDFKMDIKYINRKPEAKEYNRLTDSVGWGMRSEKIIQHEELGAGMILK